MSTVQDALAELRDAAAVLLAAEADRDRARTARDGALRAARDAGATWDALQQAAGVARATVDKALRRS